jgi:shikimate dehydrogenase
MREFGLIGRPLSHSFSKKYFTEKFLKEGIADCSYENFELQEISELPALIQSRPALIGLNITIPYKTSVIPFLSEVSETAKNVGAVNCIHIKGDKLVGHNTDMPAFKASIQPWLQPHHNKALILGSGGASKAVHRALTELKIESVFVSRQAVEEWQWSYNEANDFAVGTHFIIVNTTPVGMFPGVDEMPPLDYDKITKNHLVYDLIYNPAKTKFLQEAEQRGAVVLNGFEMLVRQAEESWRIWNSG